MFGGAASFGGSGKPLATPAPANNNGGGGFSFGATPSKPAANQNATSGGGGFSFGATPTPSGGAATSKPANGGGGFAFGATPAKPAAAGSTKPATGGGLSFGATPRSHRLRRTQQTQSLRVAGALRLAAPAKQNTTETRQTLNQPQAAVVSHLARPLQSQQRVQPQLLPLPLEEGRVFFWRNIKQH